MSENNEIAGAITYPKGKNVENGSDAAPISQPRQPTDLQGLLRFAMEATKAEDAPNESSVGPIDEERKKFLENALASMSVDVIEILQTNIKILQNCDVLTESGDIAQHVLALETILDYIDNTDVANDFHKIGGFSIFNPCLKCVKSEIRAGACDVIAELCQNNPYCQRMVLDAALIPTLVKILATDSSNTVCVKALYAISCVIRQYTEGFHQFVQYEGLSVLLKTLQKNDDKLTTKTTFLLSSLCGTQPDLMSRLVFLEYVPLLISLLNNVRKPSHEHILSLLLLLATENHSAMMCCKDPKYKLQGILENHIKIVAGKEEYQEEESYCRQLLRLLFPAANGL
ncbi:hypothetical protein PPYR_02954 [Photinus pyralis]|uniref:Nucleotide exchange factor Fes1 domain-containing protein n=1 Tax=Photinus pyralis TaxID=7054 RepID=A0A1Y1N9D1_PHOPY|nr:hsp70-binding protein 1-like [Photinus pyralis]KAB0791154.1 hypothetical protein PPYR_02954 [Photinus pyralis]